MKARFEVPELEVVRLGADDIITGSGCSGYTCEEFAGGGGKKKSGNEGEV